SETRRIELLSAGDRRRNEMVIGTVHPENFRGLGAGTLVRSGPILIAAMRGPRRRVPMVGTVEFACRHELVGAHAPDWSGVIAQHLRSADHDGDGDLFLFAGLNLGDRLDQFVNVAAKEMLKARIGTAACYPKRLVRRLAVGRIPSVTQADGLDRATLDDHGRLALRGPGENGLGLLVQIVAVLRMTLDRATAGEHVRDRVANNLVRSGKAPLEIAEFSKDDRFFLAIH